MVRHIVAWNYLEGFTQEENLQHAARVKAELEALPGVVPGLISLQVDISPLPTSDRDVVLNSLMESEEALAVYQAHPAHVNAGSYLRTVLINRTTMDFLE